MIVKGTTYIQDLAPRSASAGNFGGGYWVYPGGSNLMRPAPFIFGALVLIGLGSALVLVTPQRNPQVVTQKATPTRADEISTVPVSELSQYPPQHATPCDFSAYHPTSISDWLPRVIATRAMPSDAMDARRLGVKGTVNVLILINRQGAVERVCSTGPIALRKAAEAAAVEFRFKRPTINQGVDPFGYIQETLVFEFLPGSP